MTIMFLLLKVLISVGQVKNKETPYILILCTKKLRGFTLVLLVVTSPKCTLTCFPQQVINLLCCDSVERGDTENEVMMARP